MIPALLLVVVGALMHGARSFTADTVAAGTELAFGYLLLVAYFGGRLVSQISLPRLTGYLLAGAISGPFVLDLVTREMTGSLRIVNGAATCILGLTAGAELNFKRVKPYIRTVRALTLIPILGSMVVLAATLFAVRGSLPLFDSMSTEQALAVCGLIGVALAAQSPAVAMALLSELRADGPLSQVVLATVVVADLVVVLVYSLVGPVVTALLGGGVDVVGAALAVGWELLGSMLFGVTIGMLIGLFLRYVKTGASMFSLLVCVVVAEVGALLHLDPLVVMLAAGIWLENFSRADSRDLLHEFEAAELPVYLVFFALAGSRLDPYALVAIAGPVMLLASVRGAVFFAGSRVAGKRTGAAPTVTKFAWTGLLPQAGLSLALVVSIQSNYPSFGGEATALLLSVLGVNQIVSPILFRIALIRSGEAGQKAAADLHVG